MSRPQYIISHDVGTSSNKAVLIGLDGKIKAYCTQGYPIHYPQVNWAEQDPEDYWNAVCHTTKKVMQQGDVSSSDIAGVIFTTQTIGIIPMDGNKRCLRPAIIWMDGRASKQADQIMSKFGGRGIFSNIVGTAITGKDGLAKLLWIKQNEPDVYKKTEYFLDVNGYLTFKMTGRQVYEWSCASTIGFDLKKNDWMRGIIRYIGLDLNKFPELVRSTDRVGGITREAAEQCGLLEGIPVFGGCGDMQSAAIGAGAVSEGEGHICLGTSGWVGVTTSKALTGRSGVVTLKSGIPDKNLLLGEMETAGVCLEWIKDEFYRHEQQDASCTNIYGLMDDNIRSLSPGADYLIFTPWLYGERCPVSDTYVRSTFFNMSASHKREHMLKAVYEGIAFNLRWIVEIIERRYSFSLSTIKVIGGGSKSDEWMQIMADIIQRRIQKVEQSQMCGAVGAAFIAAVGLKAYRDFDDTSKKVIVEKTFLPRIENKQIYDRLYRSYKLIYRCLRGLYRNINSVREQTEGQIGISNQESISN